MPDQQLKPKVVLDEERDLPPLLPSGPDPLPRHAELHCISNFSFQRGASHPQELVRRAYNLGYEALAITDECSVAGVVRAWSGWNEYKQHIARLEASTSQRYLRPFRLLYGSEFDFGDARLVAIARDLEGWGNLCEFITAARTTEAPKGEYQVGWEESRIESLQGCEILLAPQRQGFDAGLLQQRLALLKRLHGEHLWLAVELPHALDDDLWLAAMREAGARAGVPLVAAGNVHMHLRSRKPLQDVITAVRLGRPVAECGFALQGNAERHLRQRKRLAAAYPADLLAATLKVMERCHFKLDAVRYNYPLETVPAGMSPTQAIRHLTYEGAARRYPQGIPEKVHTLLEKELALITLCKYEMFFLTVHDIVRFAEGRGILCQGRGSAANSVVCFCLGITAMDPMLSRPLLERFISLDRRNEPPDIDVDFEHERREEVIQYIYAKYGRERAAIAAVVIGYRTRSALRDVGKALGIPAPLVDAYAKDHHWFDDRLDTSRLELVAQQLGVALPAHQAAQWLELSWNLLGFPRHLSQHVGGFVLTQTRLTRLVPVEKASMKDRSIIQWDKDDLEDLGLMKVDVLALGMLTAIRRCIDFAAQRRGLPFTRYDIPDEDPETYAMIQKADTVGVFQIESRAQMSMLPRLKPTTFYDLVVEVAIVRPGPITGGMVHPYLKARARHAKGEPIEYERSSQDEPGEAPRLQKALERTLGIPIFQEQVMEISMIAAGFTATEADSLRRAMAAWKRKGGIEKFRHKVVSGMLANGYTLDFAERIFRQIEGFGDYGFPESHAYSFALLAYKSSWLKCHEPEAFLAAMLNSQPMGFYAPAQLVQDARRHHVIVLPPDVSHSDWDCTLEPPQAEELVSDPNFSEELVSDPNFSTNFSNFCSPAGKLESDPNLPVANLPVDPAPGFVLPQTSRLALGSDPNFAPEKLGSDPNSAPAPRTPAKKIESDPNSKTRPAVRLGLRLVAHLSEAAARRIEAARGQAPFSDVEDLARRARLDAGDLKALAAGDALLSLAGHRRQQVWEASAQQRPPELLHHAPIAEAPLLLPEAREGEEILFDYASLGLTLRRHPLALLRPKLQAMNLLTAGEMRNLPNGRRVGTCGIVTVRQQPGTANGTIFVTMEDETGPINVIVWKSVREKQRATLLGAKLLAVRGVWQRDNESGGEVRHVVAETLEDLTPLLGRLGQLRKSSRDFH